MNFKDAMETAWSQEYQRKGIPSSFRKDPTKVLVEFIAWAKERGKTEGFAADIGCGQGRNSFYLVSQGFHVAAIDLLQENADSINDTAKKNHLPVRAYAQTVAGTWPIAPNSLDIAIDIFCYKHVTLKEGQKKYRNSLWNSLKPDGHYFISLASDRDGFYGPLLDDSTNPDEKLIIDPHSNIPSFLYSLEDLIAEFSDLFELIEARETSSISPMYGKEYQRSVLNCIFKKRSP